MYIYIYIYIYHIYILRNIYIYIYIYIKTLHYQFHILYHSQLLYCFVGFRYIELKYTKQSRTTKREGENYSLCGVQTEN